ncbi:septal ring lytic transglycosylase RlpA family protein [Pseudorhodoplanes sinuspersici]|uniref:Endolytic peptidoglycan transglycosylase RlpA n=1 Tax=Pseudorhodoplanes sinuspersici TaxID=1235591 RepID=A0A1W6ZWF6_9HYPH|nr:septal ring lytic transglycosylase RlpA family protein [Pseudorhodoplanes sinuspersici]ARQ01702.1 septal ring lytic transglycosylase RlpA family lipoprotein [Pseudorhodoplanes sinuspersici]RKE73432.1 rare lipoprotein A [Pseudorhodoplanes sinuspersici]
MPSIRGKSAVRAVAAVAACLLLANCAASDKFARKVDPKYGVSASPRVVQLGERAPKGGGVYRVGKPYVVAGRTYNPEENTNYKAEGLASWYGTDFHGRLTANGEVFDMESITAAHPTLPLPSYVRVTNLANKKSLVVRVNDRGPFHGNRVLDVSHKSAQLLGFKGAGVARVKVEYIGRAALEGSDDSRLMATLRQGEPAPTPILVASAGRTGLNLPEARGGISGPVPVPAGRPYNLGDASSASLTDVTAAERRQTYQAVADRPRGAVSGSASLRYDSPVGYVSGRGLY